MLGPPAASDLSLTVLSGFGGLGVVFAGRQTKALWSGWFSYTQSDMILPLSMFTGKRRL